MWDWPCCIIEASDAAARQFQHPKWPEGSSGTVVAIESDALWVETIQRSACDTCSAQKGCGQQVLSKLGSNTSRVRILLPDSTKIFSVGQVVTLGIPEDIVVKSALLIYFLPLLTAILAAAFAQQFGDLIAVIATIFGLITGGLLIRFFSQKTRNDLRYNPVLL